MKKKQAAKGETSTGFMDLNGQRVDFNSILKDVENFSSRHSTWKERKELQNKKVASLGGKPPKKQRLPLSIACVAMKKQKDRDQKMLQENMILGRFGMKQESGTKKVAVKRKLEDRVLKSTVGHFRDGVLDVKELLKPSSSRGSNVSSTKGGFIGFGDESFSGPDLVAVVKVKERRKRVVKRITTRRVVSKASVGICRFFVVAYW